MKRFFYLMFLLISFVGCNLVLAQEIEPEIFVEDKAMIFSDILKTSDNGYVTVGVRTLLPDETFRDGFFNPFIVKYDKNGNELWRWVDRTINFTNFTRVYETSEGNYLAVGSYSDPPYPFVAMFSKNGELLWKKSITSLDVENMNQGNFSDVIEYNGNYLFVGNIVYYNSSTTTVSAPFITILDKNGNSLYFNDESTAFFSNISSVVKTNDGYVLAGTCSNKKCMSRRKTDHSVVWEKTYNPVQSKSSFSEIFIDSNNNFKGISCESGNNFTSGTCESENTKSYVLENYNIATGDIIYTYDPIRDVDVDLIKVTDDDSILVSGTKDGKIFYAMIDSGFNIEYSKYGIPTESVMFLIGKEKRTLYVSYMDNEYDESGEEVIDVLTGIQKVYMPIDIYQSETLHGTYDVKQEKNKMIVIPKPDNGYIVNGVFVSKQSNSEEYIPYTKVGNEYHFIVNESVNVSVVFKKNKNESVLFNKIWSQKENSVFVGEEKYFSKILSPVYKNSNGILMYENLTTAGGITGKLKQIDFSGNVKKEKSLNNYFIISLVEGNDCFYAIAITMDDSKNYFLKIDNNLNIVESKNITESINIFDFSFSNVYGFDLFVFNENKFYLATVNALYVYDSSFNLISTITDKDGDFCSIIPSYCMLNLELSDGVNIRGYDILGEKVAVVGDVYNSENDRYGYLSLIKDGEELLEKKFDNYYSIMNVVLLQDYIVITAEKGEVEIIILDYSGNIIQTIYESSGMFNLTKNGSGFFVVNVGYVSEANNSCEYYEPCFLYSVDYYDLSPTISIVGDNKNNIEIVSNARPGDNVQYKVYSKFGYTFDGLKITDESGNVTIVNTNSFVMPDTPITVEPIFSPIINPDTGAFISISFVVLIGFISFCVYRYGSKKQPILKI